MLDLFNSIDPYNMTGKEYGLTKEEFDNLYMTDFIQLMINSGNLPKAIQINEAWLEFDSIHDVELGLELIALGRLSKSKKFLE